MPEGLITLQINGQRTGYTWTLPYLNATCALPMWADILKLRCYGGPSCEFACVLGNKVSFHTPYISKTFDFSLYYSSYFQRYSNSFNIPHKKPMATDKSHSLLIFSSPGPQGVAPYKVEIQKRFSSIFIADVSRILLVLPMMFKYSDYSPPGPGIW